MERKLIENDIMSFSGTLLKELPQGFKINGSLDLTDAPFNSLPEDLLVSKNLIISNSKITNLPNGLKVGRDLILGDRVFNLPNDIVIGGKIITNTSSQEPPFNKNFMIITDDKVRVSYRFKKQAYVEKILDDYYYPEAYFYHGIDPENNAIEFLEDGKTFIFSCKSAKEGFRKIDWQRAENAGLHRFDNYDVDTFRTVDELKEIYQICTGACETGIKKFKKIFNIDENALYTIRQLGDMVAKLEWVNGSVRVFFKFFNLSCPRLNIYEEDAN